MDFFCLLLTFRHRVQFMQHSISLFRCYTDTTCIACRHRWHHRPRASGHVIFVIRNFTENEKLNTESTQFLIIIITRAVTKKRWTKEGEREWNCKKIYELELMTERTMDMSNEMNRINGDRDTEWKWKWKLNKHTNCQ